MEKSHFLRRFLITAVFAISTVLGISILSGDLSQAGNSYASPWSKTNKPVFYGTTAMTLQKGTPFSLSDARMRIFARDFEDGDLTSKIQVSGADAVNTAEVGEYHIVYTVRDSHNNSATANVTVKVVDDGEDNIFKKTLYTGVAGARSVAADRQMLGFMLTNGQSVEVTGNGAKLMLYDKNGALINSVTASASAQALSANQLASLVATTPATSGSVELTIKAAADVAAMPYYHYGDSETAFRDYWTEMTSGGKKAVGAIDGQSMLFYLTANDKPSDFATGKISETLKKFDDLIESYDKLLGLKLDSGEAWDQAIRAKYFVRGGATCSGEAVYQEGTIMLCGATTASAAGFNLSYAMTHALAHAYQDAGLIDNTLGMDADIATNILVNYVREGFAASWFGDTGTLDTQLEAALEAEKKFAELSDKQRLYVLVKYLDKYSYADTYAVLAQTTREMRSKGTLAQYFLADRYVLAAHKVSGKDASADFAKWGVEISETVKEAVKEKEPEAENPGEEESQPSEGEENGDEQEKPSEDENNGEEEQPSEEEQQQPGFETEKPDKNVFTVVALTPNKTEGSAEKPSENKKPEAVDPEEGVVISVVASGKGDAVDAPEATQIKNEEAANNTTNNDGAVTESVKEPELDEKPEDVSADSSNNNVAIYAVVATVVTVLVAGLVFLWVREK